MANKLEEQQEAWLKYYRVECYLIGELTGPGIGGASRALQCMAYQVDRRYRRTIWAMRCFKKTLDEKSSDESRCFYQLAPLAGED